MISKFSIILAKHFAEMNIYKHEEISIYKYGFELLVSTAINLFGILLISLIMRTVVGAVFFCMAFIPLRLAAGGYHAKHHWSCILEFNVIFLAFAVLLRYINNEYLLPYSLVTVTISSLLIWSLSPVEAVNKPLKNEQKERQRKRSIIIACANLAATLLFYIVEAIRDYSPFLVFYNSGAFAASLSLVAAKIVNRNSGMDANTIPK